MVDVVGVRFKKMGKVYYFDPGDLSPERDDNVIVETSRGVEFGTIVMPRKAVDDSAVVQPLKKVIRPATERDCEKVEQNREKEKEAFRVCQEKIREHGLEMKLVDVEYTFDHNKILFYFTADGRVDFRELVRDLAGVFKTRIELRQIGVRDEAKMLGGLGVCGRPLCCNSYLSEFQPVSIKMAKEQSLSLNPTKISGTCGRLMCCLKNEQDAYEALLKETPNVGSLVKTPEGKGNVTKVNLLKGIVTVAIDVNGEKAASDFKTSEIEILKRATKRDPNPQEMEELKKLED
ncbi:MAG: stage 0 sporulation protein [Ruminococcaceae bacterium]|nr:stage 0 sporulation protein [Oscillospiraceae bacterium]